MDLLLVALISGGGEGEGGAAFKRHFTVLMLPSRVTGLLKTSLPVHQGLTLWTEPGFHLTQLPEAWATEVFLSEDEVHIVNKIRNAQDENDAPAT